MNSNPETIDQTTSAPAVACSAWFGATRYRIVTDRFNGFEVQARRWWFPFWMQVGINTNSSPEEAKAWLARRLSKRAEPRVVEYFDAPNDQAEP